ncbi:hypothetical protein C5167_041683, partial [Papaver somniferum]
GSPDILDGQKLDFCYLQLLKLSVGLGVSGDMDGAGFYMSGGGVDIAGGGDSGIVGAVVLIFQILVDTRHHSAQFITGKGKNIVYGILGCRIYNILGPRYTLFVGYCTYGLYPGAIMTSYPPRDGKGPCTAIFWSIFNIGGTIERRLFQLLMGDIEEAALRLLWAIIYPFSC